MCFFEHFNCSLNLTMCFHRSLKPLDLTFLKAMDHKVNIVPVIAKADTLTKNELARLKKKVRTCNQTQYCIFLNNLTSFHCIYALYLYLKRLCLQIMEQLETMKIQIYKVPDCDEDEDIDYKEQCHQLKVKLAVALESS